MEPFTIRCETCRAKLRVRDERVLGQIHECPKCGSMVHIAATAAGISAAAMGSSVIAASPQETLIFPAPQLAPQPATPAVPEVAAAEPLPVEAPPIAMPPGATDWSRIAFWSAGAAAVFIAGGIVGALALRGGDANVATEPASAVVAAVEEQKPIEMPAVETPVEATKSVETAPAQPAEVAAPVVEEKVADVPPVVAPAVAPPKTPVAVVEEPKPQRTMTLDPVKPAATVGELVAQLEEPQYETVIEQPAAAVATAKPQVDGVPGAVTNIRNQLAMPIVGIELNAVPLSSFIETMSQMAAVPIVLDDEALKAAGVTPKTRITVRAQEETIESLLTATLAQHHLAWQERDGKVVVVPAN